MNANFKYESGFSFGLEDLAICTFDYVCSFSSVDFKVPFCFTGIGIGI